MEMNVIWLFLKGKGPGMMEEGCESRGNDVTVLFAEFSLSAENCTTMVCVSGWWDALPWKFAIKKIYNGIGQWLQVISSRLLKSHVRVDGGIANGAYKAVAFGKRNVEMVRGVAKVLSQSEVNEIYCIVNSDHEVVWLDVAVYVAVIMKRLQGV